MQFVRNCTQRTMPLADRPSQAEKYRAHGRWWRRSCRLNGSGPGEQEHYRSLSEKGTDATGTHWPRRAPTRRGTAGVRRRTPPSARPARPARRTPRQTADRGAGPSGPQGKRLWCRDARSPGEAPRGAEARTHPGSARVATPRSGYRPSRKHRRVSGNPAAASRLQPKKKVSWGGGPP